MVWFWVWLFLVWRKGREREDAVVVLLHFTFTVWMMVSDGQWEAHRDGTRRTIDVNREGAEDGMDQPVDGRLGRLSRGKDKLCSHWPLRSAASPWILLAAAKEEPEMD